MSPWIATLVTAIATLALGRAWLFARRRATRARAGEQSALRLMRLSAQELGSLGITLHGHAGAAGLPGLGIAAAQVLAVAEALADHAPLCRLPRGLREQKIDLRAALDDAVTAAKAALRPGRRNWRLPAGGEALVWADARALRHVLGHVLADAMRGTCEDDWIDISLRPHPAGLAVVVEDEGHGLASPSGIQAARDSRGIGLRLTLARTLMQAHGGQLEIEARPRIGCRVTLLFPAARLRRSTASGSLEPALG